MRDETALSRIRKTGPPTPTLRDVLAVIFRQQRMFWFVFPSVFLVVSGYGLLAPSYQSHMKILLRRGRVDALITPGPSPTTDLARPEISEEELNSEAELLRDDGLLRRVAEVNGLAGKGSVDFLRGKQTEEMRLARAARRLAGRIKIDPLRKTNLIAVSYNASDPAEAARVLETLASLYVEKHKELHRSRGEFPFFEQQATRSGEELDAAESHLLNFSRERGVVSADLERDLSLQRLNEMEVRHQQVLVDVQETTRRIQSLQGTLAVLPKRSTTVIRTSENPQLMETLKGRLLALELQHTELLAKYAPSYRLVREVEDQIAQTRAAIATEELAPVREETTEKDPNYEWAKAELEKAQVEQSALVTRERAIAAELASGRTLSQRLGEESVAQKNLLRGVKTAEDTYLLYAKKSEEARVADALDEHGIVNVAIAEPPLTPVLPVHSRWAVLLFGLAAATGTSTVLAFIADYLDPALRTPDEVVKYLRTPVLASLPREVA